MGLEQINLLRKQQNMTLEELSDKSGIPLGTLSKLNAGINKNPSYETLLALAHALGCSLSLFDDADQAAGERDGRQQQLMETYQALNDEGKKLLFRLAADLYASGHYAVRQRPAMPFYAVARNAQDNVQAVEGQWFDVDAVQGLRNEDDF